MQKELNEINLNEWVSLFETADDEQLATLSDLTWYDWFCKDASLINKTKKLGRYLKGIMKAPAIKSIAETSYVFFKNNCPVFSSLYDDFRICDRKTGNVIFTIVPKGPKGLAELWGKANDFDGPIVELENWKALKKWIIQS